jgi:exopolysaccharide biosynthesis polyprenyl glycosylphosphotransferase
MSINPPESAEVADLVGPPRPAVEPGSSERLATHHGLRAALRLDGRHRLLLGVADAVAISLTAATGALALHAVNPVRAGDLTVAQIVVAVLTLAAALHLHGLYRRPTSRLRPSAWWRPSVVARCLPTAAILAMGIDALLYLRPTVTASVVMTLPSVVLIPLGRSLIVRLFGSPATTRILVVGSGAVADRLIARLERCSDTFVVGQVDEADRAHRRSLLGGLGDLQELCRSHRVDRIVVAFSHVPDWQTLELLRGLDGQVPITVVPRMFELLSWRSEVEELFGLPLLHVPPASLTVGARCAKRALDLSLALLAITLASPVWVLIAILIKLDSPGAVFFRQERSGRDGRPFRIFKFRTMTADAWERRASVAAASDSAGPLFKMHRDPRVTPLGRLLRRASLDELPQLLNVVRGEMSLVGPRPLPVEESLKMDGAALTRFDVRPGLTGLWQVSGRSDLSYADLQHLDSVYVRSWSLMWDLRIIRDTPGCVLGGRGAY